ILWLSRGDGTFEVHTGVLDGTVVNNLAYVRDFNGDGKDDILWTQVDGNLLSTGSNTLWLGKGDGHFTVIPNFGSGNLARYLPVLADFNSDGKPDILWDLRSSGDTGRSAGQRVLWLSDGVKPDLITAITTGLGATTSITYKPLTDSTVYTKGTTAIDPQVDVQ